MDIMKDDILSMHTQRTYATVAIDKVRYKLSHVKITAAAVRWCIVNNNRKCVSFVELKKKTLVDPSR